MAEPDPTAIDPRQGDDPFIGRLLGGTYEIIGLLDEGGMGRVYVAEHVRLHRQVAVKVLAKHAAKRSQFFRRFYEEAEIISRLEHPHIVSVIDFDTTEEKAPYIVMELLHGESLAARLGRERTLPMEEVVRLVGEIASALAVAHAADIVHRDLKPENVFLVELPDSPSFVKLLDFGVSKRLAQGRRITGQFEVLGTPSYMAPEQATGDNEHVGKHSDQYALAAIAYEMLVGQPPFDDDTLAGLINKVATMNPPSLLEAGISEEVNGVILRGLAKEPEERFEDVTELAAALRDAALGAPSSPGLASGIRERSVTPTDVSTPAAIAAIAQARVEADDENWNAAGALIDCALRIAEHADEPSIDAVMQLSEILIDEILLQRLGGESAWLQLLRAPSLEDGAFSPAVAYLASRLHGGGTVSEALDLSTMDRWPTLSALARLREMGVLGSDH